MYMSRPWAYISRSWGGHIFLTLLVYTVIVYCDYTSIYYCIRFHSSWRFLLLFCMYGTFHFNNSKSNSEQVCVRQILLGLQAIQVDLTRNHSRLRVMHCTRRSDGGRLERSLKFATQLPGHCQKTSCCRNVLWNSDITWKIHYIYCHSSHHQYSSIF